MRAEHFEAWVAALEKPEVWRQTTGELESPDGGYCALGVCCRVDRWTRGLVRRVEKREDVRHTTKVAWVEYDYRGQHQIYTIMSSYQRALGLPQEILDGVINLNDRELEDGGPVPFPEIAAWLRERRSEIVQA